MRYSPDGIFPLDSLIQHHLLGEGRVLRHIFPNRMDVEFPTGIVCLACAHLAGSFVSSQHVEFLQSPVGTSSQNIITSTRTPKPTFDEDANQKKNWQTQPIPPKSNSTLHVESSPKTFLELAQKVIEYYKRPMTSQEIWEQGATMFSDVFTTKGKTPAETMSARLYVEVRDNPNSIFYKIKTDKTYFFLKTLQHETSLPENATQWQQDSVDIALQVEASHSETPQIGTDMEEQSGEGHTLPILLPEVDSTIHDVPNPEIAIAFTKNAEQPTPSTLPAPPHCVAFSPQFLLAKFFGDGICVNSAQELTLFRQLSLDVYGKELIMDDETLKATLIQSGYFIDGKVFLIPERLQTIITQVFFEAIQSGSNIFYYSELYEKVTLELARPEALPLNLMCEFIKINFPWYYYSTSYFSLEEKITLEEELKKCFSQGLVLSYAKLSKMLPYVPLPRIKETLMHKSDFLWQDFKLQTPKNPESTEKEKTHASFPQTQASTPSHQPSEGIQDSTQAKKWDVTDLLDSHELEYVDKRGRNEGVWVFGGKNLATIMDKLSESGFSFRFIDAIQESGHSEDAWCYQPVCCEQALQATEAQQPVPIRDVEESALPEVNLHEEGLLPHTDVFENLPGEEIFDATIMVIKDVLALHFANGYRINSPIELARLRSFAFEDSGKEIALSDEELKKIIPAFGTVFDGKVYVVAKGIEEKINLLTNEYFATGAQIIFFEEFYLKNEEWLFNGNIVSEEMLANVLYGMFPDLYFTKNYCSQINSSMLGLLQSEILRVWGEDILLTYKQLAERLPYIPIDRIQSTLGQSEGFIWNNVETYTHVSKVIITLEEQETIRQIAECECNTRGYFPLVELSMEDITARNYALSVTALHTAVFSICLSDLFDKSNKIVIRKGVALNTLSIMQNYCRTIETCTLDDLLSYEKELTGEIHRWLPMEAANNILVRVDKEKYVADKFVHFDVIAIDAAIEMLMEGEYMPLKSFTTFAAFPACGFAWNLFLLESFCRRFSNKFYFNTPAVNSRNAGAVIRKSCDMDYTEIMADAVAKSEIPLIAITIGKFLFEAGYTGRSTTNKTNEIIEKAKTMREERE